MPDAPETNWTQITIFVSFLSIVSVPTLTHAYTLLRERQARLHSLINDVQQTFDYINELFFESVYSPKTTEDEQRMDAIREQKIIIQLEKTHNIYERASKLLKNTPAKSHQKDSSTIRRIATNDQRRTPERLIESSRQISDAQNQIIENISNASIKSIFSIFKN